MKKKKIIALTLALSLMTPPDAFTWELGEDPGCVFKCLAAPFIVFFGIRDGIRDLDDQRTLAVQINGTKALFQKNSAVPNPKLKGALLKGRLARKVRVSIRDRGLTLMPGMVTFHANGKIARCSGWTDEGLLTGASRPFPCHYSVELYEDEYLKETHFARERPGCLKILGRERRLKETIRFYRSGAVRECRLADNESVDVYGLSTAVPKSTAIGLTEEHTLAFLDSWFGTIRLKVWGRLMDLTGRIEFHKNGGVRSAGLSSPVMFQIGPHRVKADRSISFYDNGMIESCLPAEPATLTINGSRILFDRGRARDIRWGEPGSALLFFRNGKVRRGPAIGGVYTHRGKRIQLNTYGEITFHESGGIRSLSPVRGTALQAGGQNLLVSGYALRFYENGDLLMAELLKGSGYLYRGHPLTANSYLERVYFNRKQEIEAITNTKERAVIHNGKRLLLPAFYCAGYDNYETGHIAFASLCREDLRLPEGVSITGELQHRYSSLKVFVKADRFYNEKRRNCGNSSLALLAEGVREIMFSDTAELSMNGKKRVCPPMQWVRLR